MPLIRGLMIAGYYIQRNSIGMSKDISPLTLAGSPAAETGWNGAIEKTAARIKTPIRKAITIHVSPLKKPHSRARC